ncbi:MAG: hypothetical protein KDC98_09540 [Planctomycetes bacterium]|nr:hypothetical protein [Planctomycetota bacterium]
MVNKGSFFQRLKDRWGSSSRVRVDNPAAARGGVVPPVGKRPLPGNAPGGSTPNASAPGAAPGGAAANGGNGGNGGAKKPVDVERVEPIREIATGAPAERRSTRKLSDREEAMVALGSHFQELTTLLRGSQAKTDGQLEQLVQATGALTSLPAIGQQQLDTLRALSVHMEKQSALGEQMAATVTKLPQMLANVEQALARAAATDERTAATVKEFHSTMERIHASMNKMVERGDQQVEATRQLATRSDDALLDIAQGIEASQQQALGKLQQTTDESLASLRRTHEDQSNRLQRVVEDHASWNRAVLVGIGLVVVGIGALIALQLLR